jgi:hypothetical protein
MDSNGVRGFSRRRTILVAWELLEFGRESVASIEDGATRIAAAQVAGLIALWTQLGTFENGPPKVLAWSAWGLLVVSVSLLGPLVTPRRLAEFWQRMLTTDILGIDSTAKEEAIIRALSLTMEEHMRRVRRGMRTSVAIAILALAAVALAYVLEKALYPP